ncbi:helix-turn-helix domain-containing protein [Flagellimonas flava]|uniref:helix-turn-helix domain-containing protein n=1 Tax=Flagellimonas flava TaxID=570519 RepID=UPI003D6492CD
MKPSEIRNLREALGLSQGQLALKIGKSLRTVQNYEDGSTSPNSKVLEKIRALNTQNISLEPSSSDSNIPSKTIVFNSELIKKEDELDVIAGYLFRNRHNFNEDSAISAFIGKLIMEGENEFIKKLLQAVDGKNDDRAKYLREMVVSLKVSSSDD